MSPDQKRDILSVQYQGTWRDRLTRMSDAQVCAIYERHLDKIRRTKKENN